MFIGCKIIRVDSLGLTESLFVVVALTAYGNPFQGLSFTTSSLVK